MSIKAHLDQFRQSRSYLETVAYADMQSGTVLFSSSDVPVPQERLDALCQAAKASLQTENHAARESALFFGATEAVVLRRSSRNPVEAVCLVSDPTVDAETLTGAASELLGTLPDMQGQGAR